MRFHDGSLFGPDDVVATVARAMRADVAVPSNYAWLAGAERTEGGVRLRLAHPFPPAFEYLAMVLPMLPANGAVGVGTGPYFASMGENRAIDLLRNEGYPAGPKSRPAIARVRIRQRPDDPTGGFDDLAHDLADWVWQLTPAQFASGAAAATWQAIRAESMRIAYLQFDAAGRSEPGGPITRPEVRTAIVRAIDRSALAAMVVAGGGRVPPGPCYPTQFGCDGAVGALPSFDPPAARGAARQRRVRRGVRDRVGDLSAAGHRGLRGGRAGRRGGAGPRRAVAGGAGDGTRPRRRGPAVRWQLGVVVDQ